MRPLPSSARLLMIVGAATAAATLATACAQIIGADFDVRLGQGGSAPDGGAVSTSETSSSAGTGGTGSSGSTGGGDAGCVISQCQPELVADGEDNPGAIAAYDDWVYWVSGEMGSAVGAIKRSRISGPIMNPQVLIKSLLNPNQLAVDASGIYWTSTVVGTGTVSCLPFGGAETPVAMGQDRPIGILLDDTKVYWTTAGDGFVRSAPKGCSTNMSAPFAVGQGFSTPSLLAGNAGMVFVTEYANPGRVVSMPAEGGALATLDMMKNTPNGITDRGDDICFATAIESGEIYCAGVVGLPDTPKVVADKQSTPATLTSDRTNGTLYWANSGGDTIMKLALGAGKPEVVASGQLFPDGVAVAGKYLYWTTHVQGGTVMRIQIH